MSSNNQILSNVREGSPFASPLRVLVVADGDNAVEAIALAEALGALGSEAEVRLSEDTTADEYGTPDAVIMAGGESVPFAHNYLTGGGHPVLVGVTDAKEQWPTNAGFDLVVSRPVNASALMEKLGGYLLRI